MPASTRFPSLSPSKDPADYPLFKGGISRRLWRLYTQTLTSPGRWFLVATAIFISFGGASLQLQGYVLAGYAATLWAVAVIAMRMYRPRVRFAAYFSTRVCAGEAIQVDVDVTQLARGRGADLLVVPHRLPASIDAEPDGGVTLPDLALGQTTSARLALRCNKRGAYTLHGFRVESAFPFNLLRASKQFTEQTSLLVYPRFTPLGRLSLPTGRRYQPGGVAMASELGESFEYLGSREYRDGDNVRDIDWRATARVGRPIVREWVEEYMLRAAVILDTHVPTSPGGAALAARRTAFEHAVSVAASVSDYMARQDYLVDIFAAGPNLYHLTAGRSLAYLDQILDILACVGENPQEPFDLIEPQIADLLERLSTVICVLLDWNESRRDFVHRLHAHGVAAKAIILRDGPCTLDPAEDVASLGEIPVISSDLYLRGLSEL